MKRSNLIRTKAVASLTANEHLGLQKEIEARAHELWRAGGCRQAASLNDWLLAEREIFEKFLRSRIGSCSSEKKLRKVSEGDARSSLRFSEVRSVLTGINQRSLPYDCHH